MKIVSIVLLFSLLTSIFLSSIVFSGATVQTSPNITSTTLIPWPVFRHDQRNTGYTTSKIPSTPKQKWNFTTLGSGAVKTTPVVADGMVFVGSDDGNFYALDQNMGTIVWFRSIGASTNSPAVDLSKQKVFIGIGSTLYALDKTDGTTKWTKPEPRGQPWYSPPNFDSAKGVLYIGGLADDGGYGAFPHLFAFNETNGNEIWRTHGSTYGGTPWAYDYASPAISEGRVFIGSCKGYYWSGRTNFWASNQSSKAVLWQKDFSDIRSSPAVAFGKVFFGSNDGKLYALDVATGEIIWNRATGGSVESSPAIDETKGLVFFGSSDGKLYCVTKFGVDVWQHNFGQPVTTSPVVGDGKVLISVGNTLYALDEMTGNEFWQYQTQGKLTSPAVADDVIFVGSEDKHVYAIYGVVAPTPTKVRCSLSPSPAVVGDSITLLGNLTTATNTPIPSAAITIKSNGSSVATLTTNSTGWFKASGKISSAGTYNVSCVYAGSSMYLPSSCWQKLTVTKLQTKIYARIVPNPASPGVSITLEGILIDKFSVPIKSATISLQYSSDYGSSWNPLGTVTTNSYGIFSKTMTAPSIGTYIYRMNYAGSSGLMPATTDIPLIVR